MELGVYKVENTNDETITPGVYARVHSSDTSGDFASGLIEYEYRHSTYGLPCLIRRSPSTPSFWVIRDKSNPEKTPPGCAGEFTDRHRAEKRWNDAMSAQANKRPIEEII